jgi:oxygen-independent coproporphyrinogen-3 oxidase
VYENYVIVDNPEITLEANPDDLLERILEFSTSKYGLSIGIQSFFEEIYKMNRAQFLKPSMFKGSHPIL